MILVTVGMQLGFDRLIEAMDELAPSLPMPVFAQVGKGTYKARNIETATSISPTDFDKLIADTRLLVAHAGIGTVLTAQKFRKPILLFPRRASMGEHRNDHQLATVGQLQGRSGIVVAMTVDELPAAIDAGLQMDLPERPVVPQRDRLKASLEAFIIGGKLPATA
ncbi:glycosyltransferase [Novosphingobium sp. SL115]|uniref:glycosyltransferase n=1 Tax=Novosphingobium sp. SL115 TaxID=2995150 RepID=UPI0022740DB6|nr:glycosyltransferase [Novosphingobium sp. SL115]MCY1670487.1 glycosyltransferase [Novosphingobium sp. SL115]